MLDVTDNDQSSKRSSPTPSEVESEPGMPTLVSDDPGDVDEKTLVEQGSNSGSGTPPDAEIRTSDIERMIERLTPIRREDLRWFFILQGGLLLIAVFAVLGYAQTVFMPVFLALTFNLLLSPLVRWMNRFRVPNPVGAFFAILLLGSIVAVVAAQLAGPAADYADRIPTLKNRIQNRFASVLSFVDSVKETQKEISEIAEGSEDGVKPLEIKQVESAFPTEVIAGVSVTTASIASTLILLYFLLAGGDSFLRKSLEMASNYEDKWRIVEVFRSIEKGVSSYLISITAINIGLGIVIGLAMAALGMSNPLLWGSMAMILNFVPFLGALVGTAIVGFVAVAEQSSTTLMITIPAVYFACTLIEGNLVTPTVLGVRLNLNPVLIFVSLLFWGWLWGIGGAILAVPILAAFKILCDHVEKLKFIGAYMVR